MSGPVDERSESHNIQEPQLGQRPETSPFDTYATSYREAIARGLSITGESGAFFAQERVAWLANCLNEMDERPAELLDFGCGTGGSAPFFFHYLGVESVVGIDPSTSSLAVARAGNSRNKTRFVLPEEYDPNGEVDLAFTNGVFHHIRPRDRERTASYLFRAIKPGGILSFWENNPWNPGTRYVMWRIPFDRDAVPVWPFEAKALLRTTGFDVLRTDFLFIFPRILRHLRRLEPLLMRWPVGAQYQVLCRKPFAAR